MEIFKLFGSVLVETSGAESSLNKVDKQAKGLTDKIGGYIATAAKWGAAIFAAVSAAGAALIKEVNKTAEYGDMIDKQSQRLGFTARGYQEWDHALQHYGTSLSEVGKQIYDMYENVANGNEATIEALETLGITLYEAAALTPEELFEKVVQQLQGVADQGTRASLASTLFKGAAEKLNPVLNDTNESTQELKGHMEALNALMSDEEIANAEAYSDAMLDFHTAMDALGHSIGSAVMPTFTRFINWMTWTAIPAVNGFINDIITLIGYIGDGISAIGDFLSAGAEFLSHGFNGFDMTSIENGSFIDPSAFEVLPDFSKLPNSESYTSRSGGFSSGLDFVPFREGAVKVHYGEAILPKPEADAYRAGNGGGGGSTTINQYITAVPQTPVEFGAATAAAFERARWLP